MKETHYSIKGHYNDQEERIIAADVIVENEKISGTLSRFGDLMNLETAIKGVRFFENELQKICFYTTEFDLKRSIPLYFYVNGKRLGDIGKKLTGDLLFLPQGLCSTLGAYSSEFEVFAFIHSLISRDRISESELMPLTLDFSRIPYDLAPKK